MTSNQYIKATTAAAHTAHSRISAEMAQDTSPVFLIAKCGEPAYIRPSRNGKGVR